MKKILLILTGGTIGSRIDQNGNISPAAEPLLLKHCKSSVSNIAEFEVLEPFSVLSENMSLSDRTSLINAILQYDITNTDGIIIAHGSDTLCYTASLTAMALRHIKIPIVFIASDLVLSHPKSNGPENFISAVQFIADESIHSGCFISYKNRFGENTIYLATRLSSAEPLFDSFVAFDGDFFGKMVNGSFMYNRHPLNPSIEEINKSRERIIPDTLKLEDNVLMLYSSPALDPNRINTDGLSAVINYGYHCGTVDARRFYSFAENCNNKNIDIWLASFKDKNAPIYESLADILKLSNANRLYNISPESAYAKILLTYCLSKDLAEENLFFENI